MSLEFLYLSRADVESIGLSMAQVVDAVEEVLREKGCGRVEMPPKRGVHPMPESAINAMPGYVPLAKVAGIKWVTRYLPNLDKGLPYVLGLLILNDPETGIPLSVMDCAWITAMRTGAASAVAAKYLARKDSRQIAMLACGVQGRSNLTAMKIVFPGLEFAKVFDIRRETAERYACEMADSLQMRIEVAKTPEDAVRGADIVVTSGPILQHPKPVVEMAWLKMGAFLSAVDLDSYIKPEVFNAAGKLYTDDVEQFMGYSRQGYFAGIREPIGDLGELVAGKKPARQSSDELTMTANLGLAIEDIAVAARIYRVAKTQGLGRELPL
ncbi:MAG TPA: ornithine cyclodeaminase family protein [Candidatus Hydrogenedentes bacterium]|nr:ornithine cyclodeaminase family protein [Candidatus Hydrogenedentota bacterium]HQH51260.1 ornithine cyclodeaminase family protein [Candidatus Hydrogenedentota bacterium]